MNHNSLIALCTMVGLLIVIALAASLACGMLYTPVDIDKSVVDDFLEEMEAAGRRGPTYSGLAVASLEERIYSSDIVVRAELVSAVGDVLTFNSIEYLKGTGPEQITISASTTNRVTEWDHREAILFLSQPLASKTLRANATFKFTDTTKIPYELFDMVALYDGPRPAGYTITSANPVWVPAAAEYDDEAKADEIRYFRATKRIGRWPGTLSLAAIKARVAWVEGGEGIEGYDQCIWSSLAHIRRERGSCDLGH